jgi:hypothetical protein
MKIVSRVEKMKSQSGSGYTWLLRQAGIGYGRFMRWKRRMADGDAPVKAPGPKKIQPFDLGELTDKVRQLRHRKKRTQGTGKLYESYKHSVSRREFGAMVMAVRRDRLRKHAATLNKVQWRLPDVVWAIDGTEHKAEYVDVKLHVQNLQDLCSVYKLRPLASGYMPCGEEIAGHLDHLFNRHGAPLFIKRDNGGNLNHAVVNDLLEEMMVIPINSPVKNAPYNGAVEHAQGELKTYMRTWKDKAYTTEELALLAETAAHDLNHMPRRRLGGKTACRVYFGKKRICFTKRKRKSAYEWIKNLAVDISEKAGHDRITSLAWRVAAKKWLEKNDLIKVVKPGKVLPSFSLNLCH